jgi:DNA-binding NarL/FixJ family response regulator
MESPINVLIFHRTRFLADALGLLLSSYEQLAIAVTSDAAEAQHLLERAVIDVVVLYSSTECEDCVRTIKAWRPQQLVVVLGLEDRVDEIVRVIEAGAAGYLLEDAYPDDVARIIQAVYEEQPLCSPRVVAAVIGRLWQLASAAPAALPVTDRLSLREQQILKMIGLGLANKEIARSLDIELCTVKNHVHRILDKLNVHSRRDAVRLATANGVV